jgi:hypothetical protein
MMWQLLLARLEPDVAENAPWGLDSASQAQ